MNKNRMGDVTVHEAAQILAVTTRSILNYIKSKEIEAVKVGKSWYIRKASLDAFAQRFGFGGVESENKDEKEFEIPKTKENFPKVSENSENGERKFSVRNLRLFNKVSELFRTLDFEEVDLYPLRERLNTLKLSAIEFLGAGYYSFEPQSKMNLYNKSRENVGAILALSYAHLSEDQKFQKMISYIEEELLPAYSALIKRMDKRREKS